MNDDTFAMVVANDVKNKATPDQRQYLRLPENWDRWKEALEALLESLDSQTKELTRKLGSLKEAYGDDEDLSLYSTSKTEFDSRIKRVERFRFYVEQKLNEVNRMILMEDEEVDEDLQPYFFLRKAIEAHKGMMVEFDFEPTPIDKALWAALEGRWDFDKVEIQ